MGEPPVDPDGPRSDRSHARNVRLIGESSRKDDQIDARTLARLARIDPGLLGPVRHRSAQAQIHLTVIRARTALVNAARGLTKSYGERLRKCGRTVTLRRSRRSIGAICGQNRWLFQYTKECMQPRLRSRMRYSARSMVTGSIRTAWITGGSAANNATARSVSDGNASIPKSVALTW